MTQETQIRAGRTGPGCRPRVRGSALSSDGSPLLSWGRVEVGGILADATGLSLWILGKIHKRKLENKSDRLLILPSKHHWKGEKSPAI